MLASYDIGGLALRGSPSTEMDAEVRVGDRVAGIHIGENSQGYWVSL
ncbi:hypothetical protein [Haloarchaeobius salinus]|nr:hypothetical protein [Haloarchaeobius salinus]